VSKTHLTVEVEGARELQARIRELGDAGLRKELRDANKSVAQIVVDAALPNVPVGKTGNLQRSVKASGTQTSAYGKAGSPARVPYAAAIHWGTGPRPGTRGPHNITGRPFLWDAADQTINRAVREYEDAIQDLLDKVVR
jgi:HK97 gp10 family phage protein